jgi:hypothetical protein
VDPRNYLEQAKSFLGGRGAKLALRIAPLALMAAGALHAGTITFTPVSGSVSGSCVNCSGAFAYAFGSANSNSITNGISFYGSGGVLGSETGTEGILFSYTGTASGTGPQTLNVSWDFSGSIGFSSSSLGAQAVAPVYNWDLLFGFNGGTPTTCAGCSGTAPADGSAVTGAGTIAVPSGAISSYTAVFDFTFNPTDEDETLNIDIPAELSIDVVNPASTGVPEPSTLLLIIPGLGLLGLVARRRRYQG